MPAIQIKDVPPELHQALRERAAAEGKTLSEYALERLRADLRKPSRAAWRARLAALPVLADLGEEPSATVHAEREARARR